MIIFLRACHLPRSAWPRILFALQGRHHRVIRNLEMIAEMNHHIRNALVGIQLAGHLSDKEETVDRIRESSSRIDWALRELLPRSGDEGGRIL